MDMRPSSRTKFAILVISSQLVALVSLGCLGDASCPSRSKRVGIAALHAWIAKSYPQVNDPVTDDWTRVCLLRQWAWRHTPWCSESAHLDGPPEEAYYCHGAFRIFTDFGEGKGGVWCGGAAYALRRLYESYGYRCWTYDCGFPDVMTHVMAVVEVHQRGRSLLVVQDSTFNITYADPAGNPLDVRDLIQRLAARQTDLISVQMGDTRDERAFLLNPRDRSVNYCDYIDPKIAAIPLPDGLRKYRCCFGLTSFKKEAGPAIERALTARGLPRDPLYLMACPLRTIPGDLQPLLEENAGDALRPS